MKALLVVDIQKSLTNKKGFYNQTRFISTVNGAIRNYRESGDLIIFIQHNNSLLVKNTVNWEIDSRLEKIDNDIVIQKSHGNSFEKIELCDILEKNKISAVVVCGLISNGCVRSTSKGGLKRGFKVELLKNGHSNWNQDAEKVILRTNKVRS